MLFSSQALNKIMFIWYSCIAWTKLRLVLMHHLACLPSTPTGFSPSLLSFCHDDDHHNVFSFFEETKLNIILLLLALSSLNLLSVYADGSICLDILQNQWSPIYDVAAILTSIQVLDMFILLFGCCIN